MSATPDSLAPSWVRQVLAEARWFSGKGRGGQLGEVRPLCTWSTEAPVLRSWLAGMTYPDGTIEAFHLVVEHTDAGPREPTPHGWQRLADSVLLGMGHEHEVPETLRPGLTVRVVEGEQTHTSMLLGSVAILKLYRTLEPAAATPDLAGRLRDAPVPRQYLLRTAGSQDLRLLTVSQQIPDAVDGWELATSAATAGRDFLAEAQQLGVMLRQVHRALGSPPSSTHQRAGTEIATGMRHRLSLAVDEVPSLLPHADACRAVFQQLAGRRIPIQAIHGDAHLGQALRDRQQRWWLTDFDGEPLKSAAERHAPDAVARDMAGVMQSFDYAARIHDGSPTWTRACQQAFLAGYRTTGDPGEFIDEPILGAYALDKAIYNVIYETRNRPRWVPIALSALTESLARQGVR